MVVPRGSRVDAVDVARGAALLGMMYAHLGLRWTGENPPVGQMLAGGRAAPLFAVLAGVALSLVRRRDPRGSGSVPATLMRALLLVVLGLVLGSLDSMPVYVILAFYGLLIAAALPVRHWSARALIGSGLAWAVVAPVLLLWLQVEHEPFAAGQAELSDAWPPWSLVTELVVWGAYPAGVWFAYVLIGLGIGRLDLTDLRTAVRVLAGGAALLVGTLAIGSVGIARGVFGDWSVRGWRQLFAMSPYPYEPASWHELWLVGEHTSRPLNVLGAIGSALVVIGACALLARVPWARPVLLPLRVAGAMTLTLYTVHVVWTWRLEVAALDDPDPQLGGNADWLLQVVVLLVAAVVWWRVLGRGPLETIVRALSLLAVWGWSWGSAGEWARSHERRNAPDGSGAFLHDRQDRSGG
jgi:uncharacterized protein